MIDGVQDFHLPVASSKTAVRVSGDRDESKRQYAWARATGNFPAIGPKTGGVIATKRRFHAIYRLATRTDVDYSQRSDTRWYIVPNCLAIGFVTPAYYTLYGIQATQGGALVIASATASNLNGSTSTNSSTSASHNAAGSRPMPLNGAGTALMFSVAAALALLG